MGAAITVAQTMPMLAAGVYQMGVNRGTIPVVSVNDQTFAQMAPRGGGGMSWADIAKVASDNQASVNGTVGLQTKALPRFVGLSHFATGQRRV